MSKDQTKAPTPGSLEPVGSASVRALKRKMESALAAFHRIPGECDLDRVEPGVRIKRMVESRLRYQATLDSMPNTELRRAGHLSNDKKKGESGVA